MNNRQGIQHVGNLVEQFLDRYGLSMESKKQKPEIEIRPLLGFDIPAMLKIEKSCFDIPHTASELRAISAPQDCFANVASLSKKKPCGYVVYRLGKKSIELVRIAVDRNFHRIGIGRKLIASIFEELDVSGVKITAHVRETDFRTQVFLRACAFRATGQVKEYFACGETAYFMSYQKAFDQTGQIVRNRFTKRAA